MTRLLQFCALLILLLVSGLSAAQDRPGKKIVFPLKVSANGRFLIDGNNKPFFYLGDTAWELFQPGATVRMPSIISRTVPPRDSQLFKRLCWPNSVD